MNTAQPQIKLTGAKKRRARKQRVLAVRKAEEIAEKKATNARHTYVSRNFAHQDR